MGLGNFDDSVWDRRVCICKILEVAKMKEPEEHECMIVVVVATVLTILILVVISWINPESPLPPITEEQKIADLNELNTRIAFCHAMGYQTATLVHREGVWLWTELEYTNMGSGAYYGQRYQRANSMHTEIVCGKPGKEIIKQYNYDKYKRWMLNTHINDGGN